MKSSILTNLVIFFFVFLHFSNVESKPHIVDIEGRVTIFFAQSKIFQEVYDVASPSYQLEAAVKIHQNLKWWNNFSYLAQHGISSSLDVNTRLKILSVSTGLKYLFKFSEKTQLYLGIGPIYSWLKEKNDSQFLQNLNKRNGIGGIIKLGITRIHHSMILSLFVDYQFQRLKKGKLITSRKINLSGLYFGVSIGGRF